MDYFMCYFYRYNQWNLCLLLPNRGYIIQAQIQFLLLFWLHILCLALDPWWHTPVCQPKMKGMCYQEVQRHCYSKVRSYQVAKVMNITNVTSQLLVYISRTKKTHKIFSVLQEYLCLLYKMWKESSSDNYVFAGFTQNNGFLWLFTWNQSSQP